MKILNVVGNDDGVMVVFYYFCWSLVCVLFVIVFLYVFWVFSCVVMCFVNSFKLTI